MRAERGMEGEMLRVWTTCNFSLILKSCRSPYTYTHETLTRGSSSLAYTYDLPSALGVGAREPWSGVAEVRVGRFRLRRRLWTSSVRNPSGFLGDGESGTATQKHKTAKIDVSPIIKSCNVYCT